MSSKCKVLSLLLRSKQKTNRQTGLEFYCSTIYKSTTSNNKRMKRRQHSFRDFLYSNNNKLYLQAMVWLILQLERSPGKQPTCRRSLLALTTKVCPAAWPKSAWCLLLEVREWEENNSFGVWSLVKFSSTLVLVAWPNFIFENSASYVFTR